MRAPSIRHIVFSGFGLTAAGVLVLAAVAWDYTQRTLAASAFVAHTHQVVGALGAAQGLLFRAESAQRAYFIGQAAAVGEEREVATTELKLKLADIAELTADSPVQQQRMAALQAAIDDRIDQYRRTQAALDAGEAMSVEARLADGAAFRALSNPMFSEMVDEEQRLLAVRQTDERRHTAGVQRIFVALVAALFGLLLLTVWQLRADLIGRRRAEAEAEAGRRQDAAHARALVLYNAKTDRAEALAGTLALLAEDPLFPVSAFYAHEELSGQLRLVAHRGAPADAKPLVRVGEGPIGTAAREQRALVIEPLGDGGYAIETGIATLRPAALLLQPVVHQGKLLGVLTLAASRPPAERDRRFVDRLAAQLGVALHNLAQIEALNLLAAQLRASGEEVRRQNESLERASRTKSEFLANMSHELRTPLNAVIGFSEVLREGLLGDLTPQQREYVGDIHESGRHLLLLINDILDLSKVEAGQMDLSLEPVALTALAAAGVAVVRDKALARQVRIVERVAQADVNVDVRKARQIVFNLLSNAVKFTGVGGTVTLTLARVPASRVAAVRPADDTRVFAPPQAVAGDWLEVAVADTGIGITAEGLRALFQPFVQLDASLARSYEGTGLGLTMVQRLAELHGGGLMAHSRPGQGATFTVWLPWREPVAAAAPAVAETAGIDAGMDASAAPLILVIEDDSRAADLVRLQLEQARYRVETAADGEDGLRLTARLQPQAVVLDVLLPGLHGWDLLARLKESPETARIPVVIVSITDEPRRGFALGAAQVLSKPVAQRDLLAALAAVGLRPPPPGRVLVVDDDPKAVTLVRTYLEAAGFETLVAYGGGQALEQVREKPPDAIVLDLMMPEVSGFDVVDALARDGATAGIPVVVLTAKLVTAQDREQLRGRVQQVMEKADFLPESLLAEVRRALTRRNAEARNAA